MSLARRLPWLDEIAAKPELLLRLSAEERNDRAIEANRVMILRLRIDPLRRQLEGLGKEEA